MDLGKELHHKNRINYNGVRGVYEDSVAAQVNWGLKRSSHVRILCALSSPDWSIIGLAEWSEVIVSRINQCGKRGRMIRKGHCCWTATHPPHVEASIHGAMNPSYENVPADEACHAQFKLVLCQRADVFFSRTPLVVPQQSLGRRACGSLGSFNRRCVGVHCWATFEEALGVSLALVHIITLIVDGPLPYFPNDPKMQEHPCIFPLKSVFSICHFKQMSHVFQPFFC